MYDYDSACKEIEKRLGVKMSESDYDPSGDPVLDACMAGGMTKDGMYVSDLLDVFEQNLNEDDGMEEKDIEKVVKWYNKEKKDVPKDWMKEFLGEEEYEELSRTKKECKKYNTKPWLMESLKRR